MKKGKIFEDYYKRIIDNRENIIDYYVKQYGEDTRKMFEERFDRIKFCIFINPNLQEYIFFNKYREVYIQAINLLEELGFNNKELKMNEYRVFSENEEVYKKIEVLFPNGSFWEGYDNSNKYKMINQSGIFIFRNDDDFKKSINEFIEYYNKNYSVDELITKKRCEIFKNIGLFDNKSTDDEIVNSPKFEQLNQYFTSIANKYFMELKEIDKKYNLFNLYSSELAQKITDLINKNNVNHKMSDEELKKEISKLCMIGGNYEVDGSIDIASIKGGESFNNLGFDENGNINEITIFYCPFQNLVGNEDIDLRHEIRHAMTTSTKLLENDIVEVKIGNRIELWRNGELLEQSYRDYNEYATQYEAIKETIEAYKKGIYIISPSNSDIQIWNPKKGNGLYDEYLPYFDIIYSQLPESAKRSQIEDNNDSLYEAISEGELGYCEELIKKKDIKNLSNIQVSSNRNTHTV